MREVVPPDRGWRDEFEAEATRLRSILGEKLVEIHLHVYVVGNRSSCVTSRSYRP